MITSGFLTSLALVLLTTALPPGAAGETRTGARDSEVITVGSGTATLQPLTALPGYRLCVTTPANSRHVQHHIPYPVYRFDAADVNNDGSTDILLGVIKTTHFDPVMRRRLFIYRITPDGIVPLWLGSRVCRDLVDFRAIGEGAMTRILTIECEREGKYCNGLYTWHGFGLELIRYTTTSVKYDIAREHFNRTRDSRCM